MLDLPSIDSLVKALPEIYQPIYGHAEYDGRSARPADDERLTQIMAVHDALAKQLGRPLRVLDLGCAQGWFGFNLAKAGAQVLGIDVLAANINLCNLLALENRGLKIRFQLMEIEQLPGLLADGQIDLVLGLSVFHHLCYHNGKEATRELMRVIFEKIPCGILEFATAAEPVKWAASLPDSPDYLIEDLPFFRILSYHSTHLSDAKRPLYFCSNRFWYFDGEADAFETSIIGSRGRRYFFGDRRIAKLYQTTGEYENINRNAVRRSAAFLSATPPPDYPPLPKLLQYGEAHGAGWLVREKIAGTPLSELIHTGQPYDSDRILRDVLHQLTALESVNLFHADVRVWNVIVGPDGGGSLIDYNEITELSRDCIWPWSVFMAFFIFVHEVVTRQVTATDPLRQPFISPYNLPEPYRQWGAIMWNKPPEAWSFAGLKATFQDLHALPAPAGPDPKAVALWMQRMEEYMAQTMTELQTLHLPIHQFMDKLKSHTLYLNQHLADLELYVKGNPRQTDDTVNNKARD